MPSKEVRALQGQSAADEVSNGDWANTKAAYRFLDNERVSEAQILAAHFRATRERFSATNGPALVLHDTTQFSFKRGDVYAVGFKWKAVAGSYRNGAVRYYAACGILMHSSLAMTTEGLPLGLAAIKFWNREKFKGTNARKMRINPTCVPIEEKQSNRWLEDLRLSTALLGDSAGCCALMTRRNRRWRRRNLRPRAFWPPTGLPGSWRAAASSWGVRSVRTRST